MRPLETDEALMTAYAAGDPAAFETLFRRYAPMLTRVMQRRLQSESDAHDLVQQTFLQLHRARFDFDATASFRPWFFTIAFNLQHELFRKRKRQANPLRDSEQAATQPTPTTDIEDVRRALATLPPDTREVISLHWIEGLAFPEVAALVGASLSAVKVRAHRGYALLRRYFEADL